VAYACQGDRRYGRGNDGAITDRDWHPVGVIEYGYVAPDPLDTDVIYGAGRNVVSKFHWSTGQVQNVTPIPLRDASIRVDRTEPLLFAPQDPHTLYYAANKVYKTRDGGATWETISPDLTREKPGIPLLGEPPELTASTAIPTTTIEAGRLPSSLALERRPESIGRFF